MNMCVFLGEICGSTSRCLLKCSYFPILGCNQCETVEHSSSKEFVVKAE